MLFPPTYLCVYPKNKDILTNDHNTVIKFNINEVCYLIWRFYSNFTSCIRNVLYSKKKKKDKNPCLVHYPVHTVLVQEAMNMGPLGQQRF